MVGAGTERGCPLERGHWLLLQGRGSGSRGACGRIAAHAAGGVEGGEATVNGNRVFAQNKKALHDFDIEETYEAGIQLTGPEVKSIREGRANLKESYARVRDGEVFL
ncbi:MAG: SsrA-binding protein, partial [Rubrobacter sp.]|nr:SsrA-binding protein [Rubrobacter sp.]